MIDKEKVIKGLKAHLNRTCNSCPYEEGYSCIDPLLRDALALLKAQEPRVLALEEVKGMKRFTICAVEQRSKVKTKTFNAEYGCIVTLGDYNFLDFGLYGNTNRFRATEAGYGYHWRCWSAKPTDEQRKAAKWDG